jgi:hypothetical protein
LSVALAAQNPEAKEFSGYVDVLARPLNTAEVQKWQNEIKQSIFASVDEADRTTEYLNWCMREYSAGRMKVWGMFSMDSEPVRFIGAMTTLVTTYPPKRRMLLIHTFNVPKGITRQGMASVLEAMVEFAQKHKCNGIEALTKHESLIGLCGDMGFDTSTRYIRLEV